MPVHKMRQFLDSAGVKYETLTHSQAFTAADTARLAHVHPEEIAKVVMVKIDDRMAMVVLPGNRTLDLQRLGELVGTDDVRLASEREFNDLFPECEHGAMPPFGNLYALPVYVDEMLRKDEQIAFNAGNHWELIRMAYADYQRLANPKIGQFSQARFERPAGEGLWQQA